MNSLCFKVSPALPSWNVIYKSPHWSVRYKLQREWTNIVAAHLKAHLAYTKIKIPSDGVLFDVPVDIIITNYAPKPIDAWNIYTKCLDALENIIIRDDGYKNLVAVTTITRKAKESFTSIEVIPKQTLNKEDKINATKKTKSICDNQD